MKNHMQGELMVLSVIFCSIYSRSPGWSRGSKRRDECGAWHCNGQSERCATQPGHRHSGWWPVGALHFKRVVLWTALELNYWHPLGIIIAFLPLRFLRSYICNSIWGVVRYHSERKISQVLQCKTQEHQANQHGALSVVPSVADWGLELPVSLKHKYFYECGCKVNFSMWLIFFSLSALLS